MWKKRVIVVLTWMIVILFIPGCWDQDFLKDTRLSYILSFDRTDEGKIKQTVIIREMPTQEQSQPVNELYSAIGYTSRETSDILRQKITGNVRYYKTRVFLLGKSLTKNNIYPFLDPVYRDPENPVNTMLAVVDGEAGKVLEKKKIGNRLIGEFINKLLENQEELSMFPKESLQSVYPVMLDPGQDFLLPYIRMENDEIMAQGSAMFHGQHFTGILDPDQTILYRILAGNPGKTARLTRQVIPGSSNDPRNFMSLEIQNSKRDFKLTVGNNNDIDVSIRCMINAEVPEFPRNKLHNTTERNKLNDTLSKKLTKEAQSVIKKLQGAQCDAFGIGRELIAHHPGVWRKKDWSQDYPKVRFHAKVQVEITGSGILN